MKDWPLITGIGLGGLLLMVISLVSFFAGHRTDGGGALFMAGLGALIAAVGIAIHP